MAPILHSHAKGIHPGAFVQPTAPSADPSLFLQNGTLWVDTSTSEPYRLWTFHLADKSWHLVGTVAAHGLPGNARGALLYNDGTQWLLLPAGQIGQQLEMAGTGLPQWEDSCCGTALPSVPVPPTGDQLTNLDSRCGAAVKMATYLEQYYERVRQLVVYGVGAAGGWAISVLLDVLFTALTGGEGAPLAFLASPWVQKAASLLFGWALAGTIGQIVAPLTTADNQAILQCIYANLPTTNGPVTVDQTAIDQWQRCIRNAAMPVGGEAQLLIAYLAGIVSLADWQQLAYFGAQDPSPVCGAWALTGGGLQGGATLGVATEQAFQGGATLGASLQNALRGGASVTA
jgi:hypothetical protein